MTYTIPRTPSEVEAHTAHLAADIVLQHRLAQGLPWGLTEALLAVARQDPGIDPDSAQLLVRAALAACIEVEILANREARP